MTDAANWTYAELAANYSDAHKDIYGCRPSCTPDRATLVRFWQGYDEGLRAVMAEDARELELAGFATWTAYYDDLEARDHAAYLDWKATKDAEEAYKTEFNRRASPLPAIENWEYGQ